MRFSHLFIIIFIGFLITSCGTSNQNTDLPETIKPSQSFTVSLEVKNFSGDKIYFESLTEHTWQVTDTAYRQGDVFLLQGKRVEPEFFRVKLDEAKYFIMVADSADIKVSLDANDIVNTIQFTGSKASTECAVFYKNLYRYNQKHDALYAQMVSLSQQGEGARPQLRTMQDQMDEMEFAGDQFIKKYLDSIMPSVAVFNLALYIDGQRDMDYLVKLAYRIKKELPDSKYTPYFTRTIFNSLKDPLAVGNVAPEITLSDTAGKTISISSFRGKYLLIDFWASWCGPCRQENPSVVKMYHQYHDKGFEILGVSLDSDRNAWIKAIQKDQLAWAHISDLKGWGSVVVPMYKIQGIPFTCLLDKEGRIVAKNLRGKMLELKLKELLGE
jgi:peroxiredoxin